MNGIKEIEELVRHLPEVYQPIFGFPEFTAERQFHLERIDQCVEIADKLSVIYRRPLKILDLGCAQGFLSLSLATHNHRVVGIEYLKENFELCEALGRSQPSFDVQFFNFDLMNIENELDLTQFDLVVAYSILHHPIHRDGAAAVKQLIERISRKIPNAIVESAISKEPVFWSSSLPKDPRTILNEYLFVRQIGVADTHLSDVKRPIHFCSNDFVLINDDLERIRESSQSVNGIDLLNQNNIKRHYITDTQVVKIVGHFEDSADVNQELHARFNDDLSNELFNLKNLPNSITKGVQILEFSHLPGETILSRTHIKGKTVESLLPVLSTEQRLSILSQTLEQLVQLEQLDLVHRDLRTWNVLWDDSTETISIVDLGAVTSIRRDEMWPFNPYYSVVFFTLTLFGISSENNGSLIPRSFPTNFDDLPPQVQNFVKLALQTSASDLNIECLHRLWKVDSLNITSSLEVHSLAIQLLVEHSLQIADLSHACNDLRNYVQGLLGEREVRDEYLQSTLSELGKISDYLSLLEPDRSNLQAQVENLVRRNGSIQLELEELQSRFHLVQVERDQHLARIEAVRTSRSWRITKPLRGISYLLRRFISKTR